MENPATWNRATKVISDSLSGSLMQQHSGIFGYSPARIIHDALEKEGLLKSAPGEGSELPALSVLEAAQALVEAMGTCHICKGLIILQEYAVHCEDCSYYCENHDGPECVPIYELHRRLKAALSSPQQEWISLTENNKPTGQDHQLCYLGGHGELFQCVGYWNRLTKSWMVNGESVEGLCVKFFKTLGEFPAAPPVTAEGKDRG